MKHPETEQNWWAPGPLAFEHLRPKTHVPGSTEAKAENLEGVQVAAEEEREGSSIKESAQEKASISTEGEAKQASKLPERGNEHGNTDAAKSDAWRPSRAPVTSYALCRKSLVDSLDNRRYNVHLLATRTGQAVPTRMPVWRQGTGDVLLQMFRARATDQLIERGNRIENDPHKFVEACASWDAVKDVKLRGCVLWLPREQGSETQYATLDVDGPAYGRKMAVHNLRWLLGEEEVRRLRRRRLCFERTRLWC